MPTVHGGLAYRLASPKAVHTELRSLSDWYNTARAQPGTGSHRLAAELQRRFVSIHPWDYDYNGRSSRLLMNWALERDGLPPSAASDFNKDLFSTTEEWTDAVRDGSNAFGERANRLEQLGNDADPITVFDLEHEHERYVALNEPPPSFTPEDMHDINAYKSQLAHLRGNVQ